MTEQTEPSTPDVEPAEAPLPLPDPDDEPAEVVDDTLDPDPEDYPDSSGDNG